MSEVIVILLAGALLYRIMYLAGRKIVHNSEQRAIKRAEREVE